MTLSTLLTKAVQTLKSNTPELLTALGVSGVMTTAYLTAKASFQAAGQIQEDAETHFPYVNTSKENAKLVWKCYIPPAIIGTFTVGCIIGASRANVARTTAAVTAYSLTEKAFSEYKGKVIEELGKGKEQKVRDELAQEKVASNPTNAGDVMILGTGDVLCCELYTKRYFRSDAETLRRAMNTINADVNRGVYATLDDFYDLVGLEHTSNSGLMGWTSDKQMELMFTSALAEGSRPCLAFDYNYVKPL